MSFSRRDLLLSSAPLLAAAPVSTSAVRWGSPLQWGVQFKAVMVENRQSIDRDSIWKTFLIHAPKVNPHA